MQDFWERLFLLLKREIHEEKVLFMVGFRL